MPEEGRDYRKYLDEKFKSLHKMIEQHHEYNRLELKQIKNNTEKTNGKVANQEKRIRNLEDKQNACPIDRIVEEHKQVKEDNENLRSWIRLVKSGFIMALVTAIGLILRIFNIL